MYNLRLKEEAEESRQDAASRLQGQIEDRAWHHAQEKHCHREDASPEEAEAWLGLPRRHGLGLVPSVDMDDHAQIAVEGDGRVDSSKDDEPIVAPVVVNSDSLFLHLAGALHLVLFLSRQVRKTRAEEVALEPPLSPIHALFRPGFPAS